MELCSIASGSSGNCVYVGSDQTSILVDAGLSGRKVEQGLYCIDRKPQEMDAILITHEHSDHIKGLGVLARKYELPVYATGGTLAALRQSPSLGEIPDGLFHEIRESDRFRLGDLTVEPFALSHDAAQPVGFRIASAGKAVGIATDMGSYDEDTVSHLQCLDAILLEANHDVHMLQAGGYPYYLKQRILSDTGHLSNENAGHLLCRILHDRLQTVLLGHLSKENNYDKLAYETVCAEVNEGDNPYRSCDFEIRVAKRDMVSNLIFV